MNTHLSSEQFDGVLSGQASQDAKLHLSGCAQCSEELASLRGAFGNFREAASAVAEQHRLLAVTSTPRRVPRMAWGLAAAALFMSIAAPFTVHRRVAVPIEGPVTQNAVTMSDEALLDNVQNDLSSSVPESLLPLAATSTNATDVTTSKESQ
jgi:hypothetical protein